MPEERVIGVDLAKLTREDGSFRTMLALGDRVTVLEEETSRLKVGVANFEELPDGSVRPLESTGYVRKRISSGGESFDVAVPPGETGVLRVDYVDVQQGDGTLIRTPRGRVITIDGGDNQLFARYLAGRFRGTSEEHPQEIDAMVVTHGDADHFSGLTQIHESEAQRTSYKRLFAHPRRVYHNGLVKRPSTRREAEQLGATKEVGEDTIITGLEEDLLAVPDTEMNMPFRDWKKALRAWRDRGPIEFRRLEIGDDDAFAFLADEGIDVSVLGPIPTTADGVTGLRFLGTPRVGAPVGPAEAAEEEFGGLDTSHTINGHSIVLRLRFGAWRLLFAGDLNTEAEQSLTAAHNRGDIDLRSEVLKVPHHGSADFSHPFLRSVSPVLAVVSAGDESARKEYIHPRATLMGALGMHSRETAAVVFVTEMVAFFEEVGWAKPTAEDGGEFYAFRRSAFGIVRVRTDGERLLVYTDSGKRDMKEAYAFDLSPAGEVVPSLVRKA
jgi:beta-lactamase superfamily II metal-dependent hydrolase